MNLLATAFKNGKKLQYKKGEIIVSFLEDDGFVYQIQSGYVCGYSLVKKNEPRIHTILKTGDVFPLLKVLTHVPMHFYLQALSDVTLLQIKEKEFVAKAYATKESTMEIIAVLTDFLRIYMERLDNLGQKSAQKRVVGRLIYLASRFGEVQDNKARLSMPLTHELIAQSINLTRENVTRELKKLIQGGFISSTKGKVTTLNLVKLQELLKKE